MHDVLGAAMDRLSPQLRRAARFLSRHPDLVAIHSLRDLAKSAAVTPATFVRLAQALGFAGYPELRREILGRILPGALSYAAKAERLQSVGDPSGIYEQIFNTQITNLGATQRANGVDVIRASAETLERARRVWIVGLRSLYPLAFYLHYVWSFFRRDLFLAASPSGVLDNALFAIERGDAMVVMTMAPYSRDAVAAAEMAAKAGARVVALTDSDLSPLAPHADHVLVAATDTPSFFHSLTAASGVVEALVAMLASRGGAKALKAIRRTQDRLEAMRTYVEPVVRRSP
ncbi:MAG TPA: MurR/RpiR family transcriptional regulator [Alphaproteobacteria bacterium]